jgi:hypothetical protein
VRLDGVRRWFMKSALTSLLLALVVWLAAGVPSASAVPTTCAGLEPTYVGTSASDDVGPDAADNVYLLLGGNDSGNGGMGDDAICGDAGTTGCEVGTVRTFCWAEGETTSSSGGSATT